MIDRALKFQEAFNVKEITSQEMKAAVQDWDNLYYSRNAKAGENPCLRLPVTIIRKLTKAMFPEYETGADDEFVSTTIDALNVRASEACQKTFISGEAFIKPILPEGNRPLTFRIVPRRNYVALGLDEAGSLIDVGMAEVTVVGGRYYTLFERRNISSGHLVITSKLFYSDRKEDVGTECALSSLAKYENIMPEMELKGVSNLGLVHMRCPAENCIDDSPDGVSIYAAAAGLIHEANVNEYQFSGEFERGKSRIVVSGDMLKRGPDGKRRLQDEIFAGIDEDPETVGITIFSPQLRHESFLARKNAYLYDIESLIGIKHGILSKAEAVEKTATEITSSAGEYNLSIIELQGMWEAALRETVQVTRDLYQAYNLPCPGFIEDDEISVSWGNGVLYDEDKTWAQYLELVQAGLLKPEIALAWYFDKEWETEQDLVKIREEYMPVIEQIV